MEKEIDQEIATSPNILNRIDNHFGYSAEDDEFISSPDNIRLKSYEYITETYQYEKADKTKVMQNIIRNLSFVTKRLKQEMAKPVQNKKFIKRCKEIIKNDKDMILRDREHIEKQMKINVAQLIAQHTI